MDMLAGMEVKTKTRRLKLDALESDWFKGACPGLVEQKAESHQNGHCVFIAQLNNFFAFEQTKSFILFLPECVYSKETVFIQEERTPNVEHICID